MSRKVSATAAVFWTLSAALPAVISGFKAPETADVWTYTVYIDRFNADKSFRPQSEPLCRISGGLFGRQLKKNLQQICKWPMYGYDLYVTRNGRDFLAYWRDMNSGE